MADAEHTFHDNGNNQQVKLVTPRAKRARASWPILVIAVLFIVGAFLTWYFTWFGRELSDADISTYLVDYKHPRKVQHAMLQIQQRIDRGDPGAKQWYPQLIALADNPEPELRLTVAWLMGSDNKSEEFHSTLLELLHDREPIVRRNAALALIRFGDASGRQEVRSILEPLPVVAPSHGTVSSSLSANSAVSRGSLLARLAEPNTTSVEIRSPLTGKVKTVNAQTGTRVSAGDQILTLESDEESVWEALRALALIGELEDLQFINSYFQNGGTSTDRLRDQAAHTIRAIQGRTAKQIHGPRNDTKHH